MSTLKTKLIKKKIKKKRNRNKRKSGWHDYFMLGQWSCSEKHPISIKVSAKESVQIGSHMGSKGWRRNKWQGTFSEIVMSCKVRICICTWVVHSLSEGRSLIWLRISSNLSHHGSFSTRLVGWRKLGKQVSRMEAEGTHGWERVLWFQQLPALRLAQPSQDPLP